MQTTTAGVSLLELDTYALIIVPILYSRIAILPNYDKVTTDVSLLHSLPGKQFILSNIDTVLYR
jgi:hypothetical protein